MKLVQVRLQLWDAYENACALWMHAIAVAEGQFSDEDRMKRVGPRASREVRLQAPSTANTITT